MKILIVEDDWQLCLWLKACLSEQRYLVNTAIDGETGWELAQSGSYDLILLDVMLPKLDGISFCRRLRASGQQTLVLLITAQDQTRDKALGLDAGADDYLVKPIVIEELEARIRALLRRQMASRSPLLEWGDLCLDPSSCKVTYQGVVLNLTAKEYGLLELFLRNSQRVFSQTAILDRLWANDLPGEDTVRAHIKRLRQKLKLAGAAELIETVYGLGYRLNAAFSQPVAPTLPQTATQTLPQTATQAVSVAQPIAQPIAQPAWQQPSQILARIASLEQAVRAASIQAQPDWRSMQRDCHQIRGTLSGLEFSEVTESLRQLEALLQAERLDQRLLELATRVLHLVQVDNPNSSTQPALHTRLSPAAHRPVGLPRLLLVSQDAELVNRLERAAVDRAAIYAVPQLSDAVVQRLNPDLIWLDLSEPTAFSWLQLSCISGSIPGPTPSPTPIPTLVIAPLDQPTDRLCLARSQVKRILHRPQPDRILEITQQIMERSHCRESKILLVDDDPMLLRLLQKLLATWGLEATALNPTEAQPNQPSLTWPERFWQQLRLSPPDLLILDVQMPELDGITLCRQLRESDWAWLPVLFLTGSKDAETMQQIFAARADDYVTKPIVAPELITRIFSHLERTRLLRQQTEIDSLTHLPNRHRAGRELSALLLQAQQDQQPFCLALLELAGLKQLNYRDGHALGDRLLQQLAQHFKQAFRPDDILARWDTAFVVGFPDLTRADGETWLRQVLDTLPSGAAAQQLAPRLGLAQYPDDGSDLETLVRVAGLAALGQS